LLVVAVVLQLVLNYRSMLKSLDIPLGKTVMVFFALLIGTSLLPHGEPKDHDRGHGNHSACSGGQHHGRDY
jgi:hypothetical protein